MSSTEVLDATPEQHVIRDESGRWIVPPKGGRPKGLTHSDKIRLLLEPEREKLVGKLLELAFSDDPLTRSAQVRAIELAMSRLGPPPKADEERVVVPGFAEAETLQEKAEAVIQAAATGAISANAAQKLLAVLDAYNRAIKTTDLERRLKAVEAEQKGKPVVLDGSTGKPLADDVGDLV